jgi:uncharacterized membrane protein YedE/YeeE
MKIFSALLVGMIFGAGLAISDMINPQRVQAFLDITGVWDPALLFVMAAAIPPSAVAYLIRQRMGRPLFGERFFVPESRILDWQLVSGAAMFGIGWGLAGFCPGPAIAAIALGFWQPWIFVGAMLAGMVLHRLTPGLGQISIRRLQRG